jgi:hypothetical protein
MSIRIPPWFTDKFPEERMQKFCHSEFGLELFKQFLSIVGTHMFIMGNPGSGKSQKLDYFIELLCELETIIYWDTGKDDMLPLFNFGKPIQILIPYGCTLEIKGDLPVECIITPVMAPELFFDNIQKDWINIISVRNFFIEEREMKKYVRAIFKGFLLKARLGQFDSWTPAAIVVDETHAIMGSLRIDKSAEAQQTGQDTANILKEVRSKGIRWIIVSQGFYDLQGTARENAPCYVVCRGTIVDRRDNPILNYISGFARNCEPRHGWVVLPNGRYFGRLSPMTFPYYPAPQSIWVIYTPKFADQPKDLELDEFLQEGRLAFSETSPDLITASLAKEDLPEDLPDLGIYAAFILRRTGVKNAN